MNCRFYGKNGMFGTLIEQHGNECGLITCSYAPCAMEISKETPDETTCPVVAKAASYTACLTGLTDADRAERWLVGGRLNRSIAR